MQIKKKSTIERDITNYNVYVNDDDHYYDKTHKYIINYFIIETHSKKK